MQVSLPRLLQHTVLYRSLYSALLPRFLCCQHSTLIHSLRTQSLAALASPTATHRGSIESINRHNPAEKITVHNSNTSSFEDEKDRSEAPVHSPEDSVSRQNEIGPGLTEPLVGKKIQYTPATDSRQTRIKIRGRYYRQILTATSSRLGLATSDSHRTKKRRGLARRQGTSPIVLARKENLVRTQLLSLKLPPRTMRYWWSKFPKSVQYKTRHQSARRALLSSPYDALRIMKDVMEDTTIEMSQLQLLSCLQAITHEHLQVTMKPSKKIVKAVLNFTHHILSKIDRPSNRQAALLRRIVFRLWKHSAYEDFYLLWKVLRDKSISLTKKTKVHGMHRLINIGKVEDALSMLHSIDQDDYSSDPIQSVCVRILRYKLEVEDLYGARSKMLAHMLELGVRPNRQLHNVIILNAMEAGDWDTGWRCHQIALAYGLKSDSHTYAILLKSANDRDSVENLRRSATDDGIDINTPRMAAEFFIATFFCVRYRWTFADLLSHYQEFFDAQPLVDLEIIEPSAVIHRSEHRCTELDSKSIPLGIMILAYLRKNSHNHLVPRIYQNYRRLVRQGHSAIRPLVETTYIPNGFLMALGRNRNTFDLCISVLEDMINPERFQNQDAIQDRTQQNNALDAPSDTISNIHPPDIRSWTILMASFLRHKQINAAEKVLTMMRAHKVWPDNVTWNTLIEGYCHQNDPVGAAWRLRCMEEDGFERDERTIRSLAKLTDKGKLMEALKTAHSGNDGCENVEQRPE